MIAPQNSSIDRTPRRLHLIGRMLLAGLLLTGCATQSLSPPGVQSAESPRAYHEHLEAAGRLSVRYEANGREEAVHGSFEWRQDPQRVHVTLLSPLGQTMAVIDVGPDMATLTQNGQPVRSAPDADALAAETLGWPLPVSGLRHWLQGWVENSANRRMMISSANQETYQSPDGWRIRYVSWEGEATPQQRPKRIDLERNTAQAGPVAIRIVIDNWLPK